MSKQVLSASDWSVIRRINNTLSNAAGRAGIPYDNSMRNQAKAYNPRKRARSSQSSSKGPGGRNAASTKSRNTTGYRGRFKKGKKTVRAPSSRLHGACRIVEMGGTVVAGRVGFIGHSCAMYAQEHSVVWQSVVRKLLAEVGRHITNYEESVEARFAVRYFTGTDSNAPLASVVIDEAVRTVKDHAFQLSTAFYQAMQDNNFDDFVVEDILLDYTITAGTGYLKAGFKAKQMKVHLKKTSKMRLQNKTRASTGNQTTNELAYDIENNPLTGKVYYGTKGGFVETQRNNTVPASYTGFTPDARGLIGASDSLSTSIQALSHPPPGAFFMGCKKSGRVDINPGVIKTSFLSQKFTTTLWAWFSSQRRLIMQFGATLLDSTSLIGSYQPKGDSRLFAFEKLLDSRSTDENNNPITLGYELQAQAECAIKASVKNYVPQDTQHYPLPINFPLV